jgi:tRNA 2-thiouridine synthesizing protein A
MSDQDSDQIIPEYRLDTTGLVCPVPILMAKKKLAAMAAGSTLEILATDPAAPQDIAAFCKATGNALVDSGRRGETSWFLVRRKT